MNRRRRTLPPVPPKAPSELRPLIAAMTEILETGEGVRGDPLDRKLTLRDILDSGIGKLRPGMRPDQDGNLDSGVLPTPPDLSIPPAPEGFDAQGSFYGMINLSWTIPGQQYRNHAYTNVFRSEVDNVANAEIVGREAGGFYSDYVRDDAIDPDDPTKLKGYYYWITFTSVAGIEGPPNSGNGTYAAPLADLAYVIGLITGQIDEGVLAKTLSQRIDLIDGVGEGSVAARLSSLQDTLENADSALARQINSAQASLDQNVAAVQQTLEASVERIDGELLSIGALYTVQVQANGLVGGYAIHNDGTRVDAGFDVDRFYIGRTNSDKRKPFIVQGGSVYMDTAFIRNGSIQEGQLGPITIGKMFLKDGTPVTTVGGLIRADAIDTDNLRVASAATFYGYAASGNWPNSGWALNPNGDFGLKSAGSGGRVEMNGNGMSVHDQNSRLRVRIGRL